MGILFKTVTIASGATASSAFNLRGSQSDEGVSANGSSLFGVIHPAALTGTTVKIQGSKDGVTFNDIEDFSDSLVSLTFTASRWRALDPALFAAVPIVRLVSSASEASGRAFTLVVREV